MKYLIFICVLFSCMNPRDISYHYEVTHCGTKIIIENSGCNPCFNISSTTPNLDYNWINSIPGCSTSYEVSKYTTEFRIDEPFDAREVMNTIQKRLKIIYCDLY